MRNGIRIRISEQIQKHRITVSDRALKIARDNADCRLVREPPKSLIGPLPFGNIRQDDYSADHPFIAQYRRVRARCVNGRPIFPKKDVFLAFEC